jgi:NADP-dependent 3-hydroxy acid dehydrogenase YdfG
MSMRQPAFHNQVAVVTGATSGIGRAIALKLASSGATVWLIGRDSVSLQRVAESAGKAGRMFCHQADLTVDNDVRNIAKLLNSIDFLVHCAGMMHFGLVESATVEDFDQQFRSNVRAPYLLTQALLPVLKRCKGQIVFLNSSVVLSARAGVGQYKATKHALKAIADCLREEVNADGIRVLSVFPGRTATPGQAIIHEEERRPYQPELLLQPTDIAEAVICALGLPRTAEVTNLEIRPLTKSY